MRNVYEFNDHPVSEEMLLGIGGGVGFIYWHMKGMMPFIGGRANARGEFEPLAGQRTGVVVEAHSTSSARRAERTMLATLEAGQPVMMQCDMGYLPYFDFGGREYHFGGHVVVVCGFDGPARRVLVADRDGAHPVSMGALSQARGSTHQPFPPCNTWYSFDFSGKRQPTAQEVRQAIAEQAQGMLEPPISNFGVAGIRTAAKRLLKWPDAMPEDALRATLFNAYMFIDATGGTGGGIFRTMFSRFLREAAGITTDVRLNESADEFRRIGDAWQRMAETFRQAAEVEAPASMLPETTAPLLELADREEAAWTRLRQLVVAEETRV